jgi:hypothetical protein
MMTVKSRPGSALAAPGTERISKFTSELAINGGRPNPLTLADIVVPSAMVSVQYTVLPWRNCI